MADPPLATDLPPGDASAEFDVPFDRMVFDEGHCFLCGLPFGHDGTMEHIFPEWLLHRFSLWDRKLSLLNRTDIPYRQLTVPCCQRCNNEGLSRVETAVSNAVAAGYDAVVALDPVVLFQWCGKILFGLLFKELSLAADRSNPAEGTITSPAMLRELSLLHDLLQSVHTPFDFKGGRPFSVLVANLHDFEEAFDFIDSYEAETVAIRLGEVGVIVCCVDHGLTEETYGQYLAEIGGAKLHAMQFEEVYAKTVYQRLRLNRDPKLVFVTAKSEPQAVIVIKMPLGGLSAKPLLDPEHPSEFRHFLWPLWEKWGLPYEEFYQPDLGVRSMMLTSDGDLLLLTPDLDVAGTIARGEEAG